MRDERHPTHHHGYHPHRLLWAVGASVAAAVAFLLTLAVDAPEGPLAILRHAALGLEALSFLTGLAWAAFEEGRHQLTRCPDCGRRIWRRRMDTVATYYPCRACDIRWTCDCHADAG